MSLVVLILLALAIVFYVKECFRKKIPFGIKSTGVFLRFFLFFYVGVGSLIGGLCHLIFPNQVAATIGWAPSPFQYEVAMANLSVGVLGILSFWIRDKFWDAALIAWSIFVLGDFVGHVVQYYSTGDRAMYNIGFYIWMNDLVMPLFGLALLTLLRYRRLSTK